MKPRLISYVIVLCGFAGGFGGAYLCDKYRQTHQWETQVQFAKLMNAKFHKLKEERHFRIDQ